MFIFNVILKMIKKYKIYEKWTGRNIFYCKGRIIQGPGFIFPILVISYLFTFNILILIKIVYDSNSIFLIVMFSLIVILKIIYVYFYLKVYFSNPGIMPKLLIKHELSHVFNNNKFPNNRNIFIRGRAFRAKFCLTCNILRPPGTSHCSSCNNCIEKYDHHCPYVGNCIGYNNYKVFIGFLFSLYFYTIIVFILIFYVILKQCDEIANLLKNTIDECFSKEKVNWGIALVSANFLKFVFLTYLVYYHTRFVIMNTSTYIDSKMDDVLLLYSNPFDRGSYKKNIKSLLYSKKVERVIFTEDYQLKSLENKTDSLKDNSENIILNERKYMNLNVENPLNDKKDNILIIKVSGILKKDNTTTKLHTNGNSNCNSKDGSERNLNKEIKIYNKSV